MSAEDPTGATFGALLAAIGIDPAGLDLPALATLKSETETMIAAGRNQPGFAGAVPAFTPPAKLPPIAGGADGAP
jgi:hypothetical protein